MTQSTIEAAQAQSSLQNATPRELYIDMVKRCVLNIPYVDVEINPIQPYGRLRSAILSMLQKGGIQLAHLRRGNYGERIAGHDVSDVAHSMISVKRLDNVQHCVETVLREHVPGDLIETGVMRGGTVILMRALLKAHGVADRKVWAADSFEGLPAPNVEKYPADEGATWHLRPTYEIGVDAVRRNFDRYGLLDDQRVRQGLVSRYSAQRPGGASRGPAPGRRSLRIDDGCDPAALPEALGGGLCDRGRLQP